MDEEADAGGGRLTVRKVCPLFLLLQDELVLV